MSCDAAVITPGGKVEHALRVRVRVRVRGVRGVEGTCMYTCGRGEVPLRSWPLRSWKAQAPTCKQQGTIVRRRGCARRLRAHRDGPAPERLWESGRPSPVITGLASAAERAGLRTPEALAMTAIACNRMQSYATMCSLNYNQCMQMEMHGDQLITETMRRGGSVGGLTCGLAPNAEPHGHAPSLCERVCCMNCAPECSVQLSLGSEV